MVSLFTVYLLAVSLLATSILIMSLYSVSHGISLDGISLDYIISLLAGIEPSCHMYRLKGYKVSGTFWIDPDGPPAKGKTNNPPYQVHCDLDPDKPIGVTTLVPEIGVVSRPINMWRVGLF